MEKEKNGTVGVRLADGQINYYDKNEQGEYVGRNTALEFLKETEEGYILIHPGQERISFDREGKMLRKENMNGRGISFSYLEDGKLEKAEADNGSSLTYNYNKEEQLEKVTDHTGRTVFAAVSGERTEKSDNGIRGQSMHIAMERTEELLRWKMLVRLHLLRISMTEDSESFIRNSRMVEQ